jgi:site-specific recombinase XerD
MQTKHSPRQKSGRPYNALNRKLAARYQQWLIVQHYSNGTKRSYMRTIQFYLQFLGKKAVMTATHLDVRLFIARLSGRGATLSRAHFHLQVLRGFYDFLNLGGLVSYVAPRLIRVRRPPTSLPRLLSEYQVRQLIAATQTLRDRALIEFFYGTGCRMNETLLLRVEDLDLDGRRARVVGKFGRARNVLLTSGAEFALRAYLDGRQTGFVFREEPGAQKGFVATSGKFWVGTWTDYSQAGPPFRTSRKYLGSRSALTYEQAKTRFDLVTRGACLVRPQSDRSLNRSAIDRVLDSLRRRAGLARITAHMFRHSFATHLLDHGADIRIVQALLGHARLSSTEYYAHLSQAKISSTFYKCHPGGGNHDAATQRQEERKEASNSG